MASTRFLPLPTCNEQMVSVIYTNPGQLQNVLGIPVVQGPPQGTMKFRELLPQVKETVFPKERFVTYEESDAAWAVPLGIAKVVPRNIREGDVVTVSLGDESMKVAITYVGLSQSTEEIRCYEVTFDVLRFLTTEQSSK